MNPIIEQILSLSIEDAEKLHNDMYNTPEGIEALDIIKGNTNQLKERERLKAEESKNKKSKKEDSKN